MFELLLQGWYIVCALVCAGLTLLLIRSFVDGVADVAAERKRVYIDLPVEELLQEQEDDTIRVLPKVS